MQAKIFSFIGGAIVGGAIAYVHFNIKEKKDIESIQQYYKRREKIKSDAENKKTEENIADNEESDIEDVDYCSFYDKKETSTSKDDINRYQSTDSHTYYDCDDDGYERRTCTWYVDDVLIDDDSGEPVEITAELEQIKDNELDRGLFYFKDVKSNKMYESSDEDVSYEEFMKEEGAD